MHMRVNLSIISILLTENDQNFGVHALYYKQHFYKQRQAEICKKIKQKLSNTLRLNFW